MINPDTIKQEPESPDWSDTESEVWRKYEWMTFSSEEERRSRWVNPTGEELRKITNERGDNAPSTLDGEIYEDLGSNRRNVYALVVNREAGVREQGIKTPVIGPGAIGPTAASLPKTMSP